eukprot:4533469-Pleurochrysis_carterae.AAC.5
MDQCGISGAPFASAKPVRLSPPLFHPFNRQARRTCISKQAHVFGAGTAATEGNGQSAEGVCGQTGGCRTKVARSL